MRHRFAGLGASSVRAESTTRSVPAIGFGRGESEAIALSIECSAARLILDDKKARRIARRLNLPVTGTLAVLLKAKERGILPMVRDIVNRLIAANFRVSDALVEELLRRAGE